MVFSIRDALLNEVRHFLKEVQFQRSHWFVLLLIVGLWIQAELQGLALRWLLR